jgi:signal transduction histidine kinase
MSAAENARAGELTEPADEVTRGSDQRQDDPAEAIRLLKVARELGNRIREHLRVEDVVREASAALQEHLGADAVWVYLVEHGRPGMPVADQHSPLLPENYSDTIPPGSADILGEMYRRGEAVVISDLRGPEGDWIAPEIRDPLVAAGVITHMLMPFGVGDTMLGFMTVERLQLRPWVPAEVHTVELVAADVGRAVHHARLYEREERLVAELREVGRAKSDFLAAVSHELRTPLTSIVGYLEVLRERGPGPLTTVQARMLRSIDRSAIRLRQLIEDVLTLSKIETGAFKTIMRPLNLAGLVTGAATAIRPDAEAKGVSLIAEAPAPDLLVSGDADQLDRALTNLLSNAVKFTPAGGQVRVSAAAGPAGPPAAGSAAVVTVRDTGIGVPEAEQRKLFDQFFRASNAIHQAVPGTGIGLTIVRSIVSNHRGTMELTSREGAGTTVIIRIPLLPGTHPART